MLQALLGSDDEEQEDPKDYCKGEAWPGVQAARSSRGGNGTAQGEGAGVSPHGPGCQQGDAPHRSLLAPFPQVATTP